MDNWHVVSYLLTQLQQLVQNGGTQLLNGAVNYAYQAVIAGATAWIAAQALAVSADAASPKTLLHGIFRIAVVVAVLQSVAVYNQWVGDVAQTLPNEVSNALSGAGGNIVTGQAFDTTLNGAIKAGLLVWQSLPSYSFTSAILEGIIVLYWLGAIICVGTAAIIYGASLILLILFIKIGPLFLGLFAFPQTRRFAAGWVSALVSSGLGQVLTVAILLLMIGTKETFLNQLLTSAQDGKLPNFAYSIISLLLSDFALFVLWYILMQATKFAATISQGVYHSVNHVANTLSASAPTTAYQAKTAASVAAGAASAASTLAGGAKTVAAAIQARRVNKMINP